MDFENYLDKKNSFRVYDSVDDVVKDAARLAEKHKGVFFLGENDKMRIIEFASLVFAHSMFGKDSGSVINAYNIIRKDMFEREELVTTGIGHGVAFPHCRTRGTNRILIGTYVVRKGVDWQAMDNNLVHIVQPIVSPISVADDSSKDYQKDLVVSAKLSFLEHYGDYRQKLMNAISGEQLHSILLDYYKAMQ